MITREDLINAEKHRKRCIQWINCFGPRSRKRTAIEPMSTTLELCPPRTYPPAQLCITDCLLAVEETILPFLLQLDCSKFFLKPVDPVEFPDYYSIVKFPMDLGSIQDRLRKMYYISVSQVNNDFQLMIINCQLYNDERTEIYKASMKLWKAYCEERSALPVNEGCVNIRLDYACPTCEANQSGTSKRDKSNAVVQIGVTSKRMMFENASKKTG